MREKMLEISHLLGKALIRLLVLAAAAMRVSLYLLRKVVVWSYPRLARLKKNFLARSRRQQVILSAGAALLLVGGFMALHTETSYATMYQCEEGACGFWAFSGKTGEGHWKNGAVAILRIAHFNPYFVTVDRTDTQGRTVGLMVHYEGTRQGNHIEGAYTAIWQGHISSRGTWAADIDTVGAEDAWHLAVGAEAKGDEVDRLHWLMAGVNFGDPRAQNDLGILYAGGYGVPIDYGKAQLLLRLSADQGNKEAFANLARLYAFGLGVKKDQTQADALYKQSGVAPQPGFVATRVAPAPGSFMDIFNIAAIQAGEVQKAKAAGGPQAGQDKLDQILYGLLNTKLQMIAADRAACQKSPECLERVQNEERLEENEREMQEESRQWEINNSHLR